MSFFAWKDDYSVGINKIDEEHRQLVGLINKLYEAMDDGKGRDVLGDVLNNLVQYTKKHFTAEESLMKLYHYPDFDEHRQKHLKMTAHVQKLGNRFRDGEIANPIQITNFLKDWLSQHIMKTDKAYGPYLNGKGVN